MRIDPKLQVILPLSDFISVVEIEGFFVTFLLDLESPRFPEPLHAPLVIVGGSSPSVLSTSASIEQSTKSFSEKVGDVIADHSDEDSSDHDSNDGSSGTRESMPPLEPASSEESLSTLTRS